MSGTEIAYAATRSGGASGLDEDVVCCATSLRACYVVSAYGGSSLCDVRYCSGVWWWLSAYALAVRCAVPCHMLAQYRTSHSAIRYPSNAHRIAPNATPVLHIEYLVCAVVLGSSSLGSLLLSAYARAIQCPVLPHTRCSAVLKYRTTAISLRARYALSSTGFAMRCLVLT
eukprot:1820577-Rhodomonas_salina.2